jgi:integrase/recombinase XerD
VSDEGGLAAVLDGWRAWQEAQGLSERTIAERAALVRRYAIATHEPPLAFTARGITRFVGRPGLSAGTRWVYRQHLASFSTYLIRAHLRADDPLVDVPEVRRQVGTPRPIEDLQLAEVLARVQGPGRMMVLLAAYAGLRVHEIAKIRGRDVDRRSATITVEGKGGKVSVLPAHDAIIAEADAGDYPARDWWFPARDGGPVERQHVSRTIRRALAAAGVEATPHQLRHWHASALLAAGVDVRVVQELMRHSSLQTTQVYTRVSAVQRTAAIGRLAAPATVQIGAGDGGGASAP